MEVLKEVLMALWPWLVMFLLVLLDLCDLEVLTSVGGSVGGLE